MIAGITCLAPILILFSSFFVHEFVHIGQVILSPIAENPELVIGDDCNTAAMQLNMTPGYFCFMVKANWTDLATEELKKQFQANLPWREFQAYTLQILFIIVMLLLVVRYLILTDVIKWNV